MEPVIKEILDVDTIDDTKYVANWNQSKWLILSSCFFIIPCAYAFIHKEYILAGTLLLSSIISVNFWREANYSWRRIADRVFSRLSLVIFLFYAYFYAALKIFIIVGFIFFCPILYCYYMSNKYCIMGNNDIWWKYHMLFHLLCMYAQLFVIGIVVNKK
jgi:hypothetical protein